MNRNPMWAITSYFNPTGYQRRRSNFKVFRQRLSVPLVAVELGFEDRPFELQAGDADILVQIRGGDVMWQKERLLSIAFEHLPDHCNKVIWIDADVFFPDPEWPDKVSERLDHFPVVQAFSVSYDLPADFDAASHDFSHARHAGDSVVHRIEKRGLDGVLNPDTFVHSVGRIAGCRNGLCWAARTDTLKAVRFYDACILGGGDRALNTGLFGRPELAVQDQRMSPAATRHYLEWARNCFALIGRDVGYVDANAFHLWHGDVKYRNYKKRHFDFIQFDFDPVRDIAMDESGCWKWSSDKPKMHQYLREYFSSRREDGQCDPTVAALS